MTEPEAVKTPPRTSLLGIIGGLMVADNLGDEILDAYVRGAS